MLNQKRAERIAKRSENNSRRYYLQDLLYLIKERAKHGCHDVVINTYIYDEDRVDYALSELKRRGFGVWNTNGRYYKITW